MIAFKGFFTVFRPHELDYYIRPFFSNQLWKNNCEKEAPHWSVRGLPYQPGAEAPGFLMIKFVFSLSHQSSISLLRHHQRPHHVVFLVLEDVAVIDILIATGPRAGRHRERRRRQVELHEDRGDLARMHLHGFLPADFIGLGATRQTRGRERAVDQLEGLPRQDLHVDQVEVNGMGIRREVEDSPGFD